MAGKSFRLIFANIALAAVALVTTRAGTQSVSANSTASASEKPKMTEEAFKNIQVLKGIPEDELIAAMQFITASLG